MKGRYADFDFDVANYNQTLINALNDVATQVVVDPLDRPAAGRRTARARRGDASAYQLAVIRYKAGLSPQLQVLNADDNRLAAEQTVTNLKMSRRDQQIGLIKALGGGFDATQTASRCRPMRRQRPPPRRAAAQTERSAAGASRTRRSARITNKRTND